jgi:hypothetical protein
MAQNATTDDAQTTTELSPVDVQAGQVYETATGVRVEVVEDDARGSKPVVVSKSDRDGEPERMSRYSFADMVNYENMTRVEDAQDEDSDDEDDHLAGEFDGPVPCPECGAFMATGYDGMGLPTATCSRVSCNAFYDDRELQDLGFWFEA